MRQKNNYQRFIFPVLSKIDPETTHSATKTMLALTQKTRAGRAVLSQIAGKLPSDPIKLFGLSFPNVLGVAAGFDKEGIIAHGLAQLGFGHVEIGTITPSPQIGNPRPRIFRLTQDEALINRMGFPSSGVQEAVNHLAAGPERNFILGISLGKQKETTLDNAADDYISVMRAVFPYADYIAINISSPNTQELRKLQGRNYLGDLLGLLMAENQALCDKKGYHPRPLLVKIAPDLTFAELDDMLQIILEKQIDGVIATNTTLNRDGLKDKNREESGGLSGSPLRSRSTQIIKHIAQETNNQLPIIGVGGIRTAADVEAKINAGAALVQIYTGLVYEGPGLAGKILRELK